MRDELRRLDHLTRPLRAKVVEDADGARSMDEESLDWLNPNEPVSLTATAPAEDGQKESTLIEQIEEPRNAIADFELRDALRRASQDLPERARFVVIMREQGHPNRSLAQALEITEGRASQLCGEALEQMRAHIGDSLVDVS